MPNLYKQRANEKSLHYRVYVVKKFHWFRLGYSSLCGAMVKISAENSVDNTGMFSLLLSSAYTVSRPFLLLTPPHQ